MGTRGPLPKPNAVRRGGNATAPMLAEPSRLPEQAPAHLGELGAGIWHECAALGWVQASDALSVSRLAELEDERREVAEEIAESGRLLTKVQVSPRGDVVGEERYLNPLVRELRRLDGEIDKLRKEIGLGPASRVRLGVRVATGRTLLAKLGDDANRDRADPRLLDVEILPDDPRGNR